MLVGDLIEAVLKDLVEMHRLVVAGRHVFTRRENEWTFVVDASGARFRGVAARGVTLLPERSRTLLNHAASPMRLL